jgi:ATP-dependent Lon protease
MSNPSMLADFAASQTSADADKLQAVLERLEVPERLNMVLLLLKKELELSKLQVRPYALKQ